MSDFSFLKNIFLITVFFAITPITLGISLFALITFKPATTNLHPSAFTSNSGVRVYASLPNEFPTVSGQAGVADARVEIVRQYLARYNSDLEEHSEFLVTKADEYGLDYRLIPAIAQQESNLCKRIPPGGFNCWGWGIHSRGTLGFNSYTEAIETVMTGLKNEYIDKGLVTPFEIMTKYVPHSPEQAWAKGVTQFMEEME